MIEDEVYWIGSTGVGVDMASGAFVVEHWTDAGPILIEWESDDTPSQGIDGLM